MGSFFYDENFLDAGKKQRENLFISEYTYLLEHVCSICFTVKVFRVLHPDLILRIVNENLQD